MRVVGYIRISTNGQTDGYGLEAQEAALRSYARARGWRLVDVLADEVSGATAVEERPGASEALDAITRGRAEVLVLPALDRLARTLVEQEAALAHVWRAGATVHAADLGEVLRDDPDDPMRTAMRQMMGVFAELERGMIRARLRGGKRAKAADGGWTGGGVPYGRRAEGAELVVDPTETEAVKLARGLRRRGRSYREIARALDEAGHRPRRATTWHPNQVRRMCQEAA